MDKMYTEYPDYKKHYKFVLQVHVRGKSVHLDFRYEVEKEKLLLGWTLAGIKAIPFEPKDLKEAKLLINKKLDALKKDFEDPNTKFVTIEKHPIPYPWLNVDNETFKAGSLGTTSEKIGFMWILDSGEIEFGALKDYSQEYWLNSKNKLFDGRLIIRSLPNIWKKRSIDSGDELKTGDASQVNMSWFADPSDPYVLSSRAVRKTWMPPNGVPALPAFIRKQISNNFYYWNYKNLKAQKIRNNLVEHNKKDKVVYSGEIEN